VYYGLENPDPLVPDIDSQYLEMQVLGTAFVKSARPGNPLASLGQFLVELRDLPRLPYRLRATAQYFRTLGSDYLNVEFGWVPFINDLKRVFVLTTIVNKRLQQLVRDNGLPIKRRRVISDTIESDTILESEFSPCWGKFSDLLGSDVPEVQDFYNLGPRGHSFLNGDLGGSGRVKFARTTHLEEWGFGTFLYWIPDIGSDRWTRKAVSALFGVNLTPELVWSVYPWSWLIDWFSNIGEIISSISENAVDREALFDFAVCRRKRTYISCEVDCTWPDWQDYGNPDGPDSIASGSSFAFGSVSLDQKLRLASTPFGFGINPGAFTARQWAILAALGLSHQRSF
jgi:hypothetical protein